VAVVCALLLFGGSQQVYAAQITQGNAFVSVEHKDVPYVKNTNRYTLPKSTVEYKSSREFQKESKLKWKFRANSYAPTAYDSISTKWRFRTQLFLPVTTNSKEVGGWGDPQSIVITPDGRYIYVAYSHKAGDIKKPSKGFIVRYDYKQMKKLGLTESNKLSFLRKFGWDKAYKYEEIYLKSRTDRFIAKCMKVGPLITIGHGQSLAYNPKTKELWMWQDREKAGGGFSDPNGTARLQRISTATLKPNLVVNFKLATRAGTPIQMGHNLAFDNDGNAYFAVNGNARLYSDPSDSSTYYGSKVVLKIYKITFTKNKRVRVSWVQNIQYGPRVPGSPVQSMGYNPRTDKLVVIADDSIITIPASKLTGKIGDLKASDIHYANFKTGREFEGIAFDKSGYGHLLLNRGPEILRTTAAVRY
jgi:DNA-binding beta-propeller fold protein YncE